MKYLNFLFLSALLTFVSCSDDSNFDESYDQNFDSYQSIEDFNPETLSEVSVLNKLDIIKDYVSKGMQIDDAIEKLGNVKTDKELAALKFIIDDAGIDNVNENDDEVIADEENVKNLKVAKYYWVWDGKTTKKYYGACGKKWYQRAKKYKCQKRFGSSCSNVGTGIYATSYLCNYNCKK